MLPNKPMEHVAEKQLLKDRIRYHKGSFVLVILALLTLLVTSIYAFNDGAVLAGLEISVFKMINALPDWMRSFFVILTNIATIGAVALAGFIALIKSKRRIGLAILFSGAIAWLMANTLKELIGRARPNGFIDGAMIRYAELAGGNGFPSGHSTVAAACGMSLALILPRKYTLLIVIVVLLVGVSRVYLGVHLPLDVVGGWAIGIVVGYLVDFGLRVERARKVNS